MDATLLQKLGLSHKSAVVYLALLRLGPSSVRSLAEQTGMNRGTTYDMLKDLEQHRLVSFYKKESKQQFIAEPPERLRSLVQEEEVSLQQATHELEQGMSELEALYHRGGERPVARYYERGDLKVVLEDVLETCEQTDERLYRVYSAEGLRPYLYEQFPTFSDVRIAKGICVQVIAIGEGGELRGLDERRWLQIQNQDTSGQRLYNAVPTYILMYPGKTAFISLNAKKEPVGVIIENDGVYETQKTIFDTLWQKL